ENQVSASTKQISNVKLIIISLRALILAYDRLASTKRAHKLARRGLVVICDRYPKTTPGQPDGPILSKSVFARSSSRLFRCFVTAEASIYSRIPLADLSIKLKVPLNIALSRNIGRNAADRDSEEWIIERHDLECPNQEMATSTLELDNKGELDELKPLLQSNIWRCLSASSTQAITDNGLE
ncbi:MAG: hypothetical protein KDD42_09965, partial [Bdellovibrionales bacterium]|nr:hypothetical protein [Bdellovibrionales bacterium]